MRVELLRGRAEPVILTDVARVLVCGDDGTPLAAACEWSPGVVLTAHAQDANFARLLAGLGIDRTVLVDVVGPRPAADLLV